jgi:UDP-N-acetylglucosamine/UDP-N-acetylgalactosamine diphosphorylase
MDYAEALTKLKRFGQEDVLRFFVELPEEGQAKLLKQVEALNPEIVAPAMRETENSGGSHDDDLIEPIASVSDGGHEQAGLASLRAGELAILLLAGGQASRLGGAMSKGMVDIGITRPLYIFQRQIENILRSVKESGVFPHLCIMTSELNGEAIAAFLKEHGYFGYDAARVHFFVQGALPAVGLGGKYLLAAKDSLALAPDGNGNCYAALAKAGLAGFLKNEGVKYLEVVGIDNVLQRPADAAFLGAFLSSGKSCAMKVTQKAYPDERVGVACKRNGKPSVIEYFELTDELRNAKGEDGKLLYGGAIVLDYIFRMDMLDDASKEPLPYHLSKKKIKAVGEGGNVETPERENGYKFETLILDMVEKMESALVFEVLRDEQFAPIKNRTGVDSIESAQELLRRNDVEL